MDKENGKKAEVAAGKSKLGPGKCRFLTDLGIVPLGKEGACSHGIGDSNSDSRFSSFLTDSPQWNTGGLC